MKKRILSLMLILVLVAGLFPVGALSASDATLDSTKLNGLPVLDITINTKLDYLHQDKDNAATDGQVILYDATGKQKVSVRLTQFKGRGNASWAMAGDKRSYNLKCKEQVELITGAGKCKNWVLVANNVIYSTIDRTSLANMAALSLYQQMGGASALSFQPIELWINGEYRGCYLLVEKVEIQKNRVDITKPDMVQDENPDHLRTVDAGTSNISAGEQALLDAGITHFRYAPGSKVKTTGGYILEADSRYQTSAHDDGDGEASWFITRNGAQIVVKEPEFVTLEQMTTIATYVQKFEDALYNRTGYNSSGKYYADYIDLQSLAKRYLLDCLTAQYDIFKTSCYFYIDGDANGLKGKLIAGPAWDYDYMALETEDLYCAKDGSWNVGARKWLTQLLTKGGFVDLLYDMNKDVVSKLAVTMANETLDVYREQQLAAQKVSDIRWKSKHDYEVGNDFATLSKTFINRFKSRVNRWNTTVWGQEHLMGVTVSVKSGTLTASVNGTARSYEWFKVNENDPAAYVKTGVTTASYTPDKEGAYFVMVRGEPLGSAKRNSTDVAGSIMYSAVVHIGCIHSLKQSAAVPATCGGSGTAAYWTCTKCGGLFADSAGQTSISAPKATAPTGKHSWDSGVVTLEAASDATGLRTYSCKNCTATKVTALPIDPSAPPRNTVIKTEDDKLIVGNASQGTVVESGSASSKDTGQSADGSVIHAQTGAIVDDSSDSSQADTPGGNTDSNSAGSEEEHNGQSSSDSSGVATESGGEGEAPSSGDDTGSDTPQDGETDSTVTRPNEESISDGTAVKKGIDWKIVGILAVAIAACLGVLIPLTVVTIRSKKIQSAVDDIPPEPADPGDQE